MAIERRDREAAAKLAVELDHHYFRVVGAHLPSKVGADIAAKLTERNAESVAAALAQAREEGRREGAERALAAAAGAAFAACQPNHGSLFAAVDDRLEEIAQRMGVSYRYKR